jgi:N-acyl-D-amino-acid deacylase
MSKHQQLLLGLSLVLATVSICANEKIEPARYQVITNVVVVDGSGQAPFKGSVRIVGDRIQAVGNFDLLNNDRVLDGAGLTLAPGFIDTHSHMDLGIDENPDALAAVSQGITTAIVGQDGYAQYSAAELAALFESRPLAINLATYTGHGDLRRGVMGEDFKRNATSSEIVAMAARLKEDMQAGSLGLSTGLEYDPGIYSSAQEIIALARIAHAEGGRYISHLRSEDRAVLEAIEEIINIGRLIGIPVQISHIKLARMGLWGQAASVIERLDKARAEGIDITADIYPYTYWQSTLTVLLPERDFKDLRAAEYAVTELSTPEGLTLSMFAPDNSLVGKTIAEIAELRGHSPAATYLQLITEAYAGVTDSAERRESVIGVSMSEADISTFLQWPHTNICSDGAMSGGHPRGYGAFPRAIRKFVREDKILSLAEMIHKMTALGADHAGLTNRGRIRAGYAADLVLFDPESIADKATIESSTDLSIGVQSVWVNGKVVFKRDRQQTPGTTPARPGEFLRRQGV